MVIWEWGSNFNQVATIKGRTQFLPLLPFPETRSPHLQVARLYWACFTEKKEKYIFFEEKTKLRVNFECSDITSLRRVQNICTCCLFRVWTFTCSQASPELYVAYRRSCLTLCTQDSTHLIPANIWHFFGIRTMPKTYVLWNCCEN